MEAGYKFYKNDEINLKINPSIIYRILLFFLFFGEIFIFFYYYSSPDFVKNAWKSYLFVAIFFPITLVFIIGLIVESFNAFYYIQKKNTESDMIEHSKIPFLLKLFLLIIAIIICFYLKNILFISISSVNILIYILFTCIIAIIIMFFLYVMISMLYNYKKSLKELELYYFTEQKKIDQDICKISSKNAHTLIKKQNAISD